MRLEQKGNFKKLTVTDKYRLFFSYETLIGYSDLRTNESFVSINEWGNTTGKHINMAKKDMGFTTELENYKLVEQIKEIFL